MIFSASALCYGLVRLYTSEILLPYELILEDDTRLEFKRCKPNIHEFFCEDDEGFHHIIKDVKSWRKIKKSDGE